MSSVSLREMTGSEFDSWLERLVRTYAEERARAHGRSPRDATLEAKEETERLLPDGRRTSNHFFFRILDQEDPVGWLWVGPQAGNDGAMWIYKIEIDEFSRSRGIGRLGMLAAEQFARSLGAHEVGLNVFGHNLGAIALYESLGYSTVAKQMRKPLAD